MRQAGVLAAAGLIALEETPSGCARTTPMRVSSRKGWRASPASRSIRGKVATNIVVFDISDTGRAAEISARLKERGVLINGIGHARCGR